MDATSSSFSRCVEPSLSDSSGRRDPDKMGSRTAHRDLLFALDDPPTGRSFWSTAIIVPSKDFAVCQSGSWDLDGVEISPDRGLRKLLLLRSRVYELWPKKTAGNLSDSPAKKPPPSPNKIRTEARNLYRSRTSLLLRG